MKQIKFEADQEKKLKAEESEPKRLGHGPFGHRKFEYGPFEYGPFGHRKFNAEPSDMTLSPLKNHEKNNMERVFMKKNIKNTLCILSSLTMCYWLAACGQTGPLYLPKAHHDTSSTVKPAAKKKTIHTTARGTLKSTSKYT